MQEKRKTEQTRKNGRARNGQISGVQVMFAAILSIGLILAINFSSRIAAGQPLQAAYTRVGDEIEQLKTQQAQLTAQRDYVLSDAYVAQWARADGKMILPGEVLIVPVPSGAVAEVTPEPLASSEQVRAQNDQPQPWTLWWQIFFDSPPPNLPGG